MVVLTKSVGVDACASVEGPGNPQVMWSLEDPGTCWVTDESTLVLIAVE